MDERKIAFIYCVDNDSLFNDSLGFVHQLIVPAGYCLEHLTIRNATSITNAYNHGQRSTNAKYKIYIHQDVNILNRNFLNDCLYVFKKYPRLGLLGVAGAKDLPHNGVWWAARKKYGKVYHTGLLAFNEVRGDYESVKVIDGLIMITQYDLPWREDLFKGWHFYDISQSLEFIKAGFEVGVAKQTDPWCKHRHGDTDGPAYEANRSIFLREYQAFLG